jgi:8-oxo-dGTP diphosphatase
LRGTTNIPEVAVILRKGANIVFMQRQHTGYADGMFCMPGGHVEAAESFSEAAIREVMEEVGVRIKPEDLRPVFSMQRKQSLEDVRVAVLFEATKWSGEPRCMEPDRHGPVTWFMADQLPFDQIMRFQADALQALRAGKQYIETGW